MNLVRCKSVHFPEPGPMEPGTNQHRRHYSDEEYLILHDHDAHLVHIRKRRADGVPVGAVRSNSDSLTSVQPLEVPSFMEPAPVAEEPYVTGKGPKATSLLTTK